MLVFFDPLCAEQRCRMLKARIARQKSILRRSKSLAEDPEQEVINFGDLSEPRDHKERLTQEQFYEKTVEYYTERRLKYLREQLRWMDKQAIDVRHLLRFALLVASLSKKHSYRYVTLLIAAGRIAAGHRTALSQSTLQKRIRRHILRYAEAYEATVLELLEDVRGFPFIDLCGGRVMFPWDRQAESRERFERDVQSGYYDDRKLDVFEVP